MSLTATVTLDQLYQSIVQGDSEGNPLQNMVAQGPPNHRQTMIMKQRLLPLTLAALATMGASLIAACDGEAPINRVGVNIVDKSVFTGSWYMARTVIDVDYEAAGIGTFPGDAASDFSESSF